MNFLFTQSLVEILMLGARNRAIKILPTPLTEKLILLHHQLGIIKLSTNLHIL